MINKIAVGDIVETVAQYDSCPPGLVGTVALIRDQTYYIDFGEELGFTHDQKCLGGGKKYYWIGKHCLRIVDAAPVLELPDVSDEDLDTLLGG